MSSKLNLNSILRFSNNGGKERKYDRADREITDRIIRVNMKYYIVYSIRIIIYFVDDMIYVLTRDLYWGGNLLEFYLQAKYTMICHFMFFCLCTFNEKIM